MLRSHAERDARLFRLAELPHRGKTGTGPLLLGVDHQPVLIEAEILVSDAERFSNEAVAAVRTDEKTPLDLPRRTGVILDRDGDASFVLRQCNHRLALKEIDTRLGLGHAVEFRLEGRLIDRDLSLIHISEPTRQ